MARVALGGSFRTIRSYGTEDIGAYLRSLRIAKQEAEDAYWNTALTDGSEKPEDVLAYWEGQKARFAAGTIDYKTYQAKIKNIGGIVDISKVSNLLAEKDYDGAIKYYESTIMPKYEEESPAWSENFVNLQKIKEAKISYDVSLQDAKVRAKYSVGGLTGRNLANYYAEMIKYLEDEGLSGRAEYFDYIAKHGDAIQAVSADEATKERAQYNKRVNELVGEREGVITARDWVNIYTQLAREFPKGGEGYANALDNLTKAQSNLQTEEEKIRVNELNVIKNEVLGKYAAGGITDQEYASALQEMLTLTKPGSEEHNAIARELGNLQETLAGRGEAEAKEAEAKTLEQTRQQIALLEEQESERQYRSLIDRLRGKMTTEEETEARQKFLEQIMPLYAKGGGGEADYQTMAKYQVEATDLPKQQEQRKQGKLVDEIIRGEKGEVNIVPTLLEDVLLGKDKPVSLEVLTQQGTKKFAFNPDTQAWTDIETGKTFATIPTTKEFEASYALPGGLSAQESTKRVNTLQEAMASGEWQGNPQDILNPTGEQAKPFSFAPLVTKVLEKAREPFFNLGYEGWQPPKLPSLPQVAETAKTGWETFTKTAQKPYEALYGAMPTFDFDKVMRDIEATYQKGMAGIGQATSGIGDWFKSSVLAPRVEAIKGIGQKVSDIWGGIKSATSKWSPFW